MGGLITGNPVIDNTNLQIPSIAPQSPPKSTSRAIADGYPGWVNGSNRAFYNKLKDNPTLVSKIGEAIDLGGTNRDIAHRLVEHGLHKQDGSAYEKNEVSRIKGVVKHLIEDHQLGSPLDR